MTNPQPTFWVHSPLDLSEAIEVAEEVVASLRGLNGRSVPAEGATRDRKAVEAELRRGMLRAADRAALIEGMIRDEYWRQHDSG